MVKHGDLFFGQTSIEEVICMFHHMFCHKKHRKPFMDVDMDMNMMGVAKILAGGAMLYFGAKMIAGEMDD